MVFSNSDWYFKNGTFCHKNFDSKIGKYFEDRDFWQYLQNLAPSGNPDLIQQNAFYHYLK